MPEIFLHTVGVFSCKTKLKLSMYVIFAGGYFDKCIYLISSFIHRKSWCSIAFEYSSRSSIKFN